MPLRHKVAIVTDAASAIGLATVEDNAGVMTFLVSWQSEFAVGSSIVVDGGRAGGL
jgi:hypothetical protein